MKIVFATGNPGKLREQSYEKMEYLCGVNCNCL